MSGDPGIYGERLAVVLGFVTLASALATLASCRSLLSLLARFGLKSPLESSWYSAFHRYHGYYWWAFVMALILHLMTALVHTTLPAADDPDAQVHWVILSFAFSSLVLVNVVLSSCRSTVSLLGLFSEKGPLSSSGYRAFYRYHSYYWLVLLLSIAGHVAGSYVHTGIWPVAD